MHQWDTNLVPSTSIGDPNTSPTHNLKQVIERGTEMGRTGMVFSIIAIAIGAVMRWAVTSQGHGFRLSTVGVILMIVGIVGLVASAVVFAASRRPMGSSHHSYDRQQTDSDGQTATMHEEVR